MICVQCNLEKSGNNFREHKCKCKQCEALNAKLYRDKNKDIISEKLKQKRIQKRLLLNQEKGITDDTKQCNQCLIIKNNNEFDKGRHKCHDCIKIQDKNRYERNRPTILTKRKTYNEEQKQKIRNRNKQYRAKKRKELLQTTKKCVKCKKRKKLNDFSIYNHNKYRNYCKYCGKNMCKSYKARNRHKISQYNKKYKSQHKDEITKYNREWTAKRKITHPEYKIKSILRIRVNKVLKGSVKAAVTLELLGCDLNFLIEWFQFRFEPDMTLSNHGKLWHVDHVIPCASFNMLDVIQQKKCFHWTNLQPLYGDYNIIKGDKMDWSEITNQMIKIQEFTSKKFNCTQDEFNKLTL